jgi:hypothetical protein
MRDNSKRVGAAAQPAPEQTQTLDFSTPTELVDLPSKGRFYPEGHPLHGQEAVEIKFMTAKDEDILTSPSFLKKGVAIDRLIQNVLLDNTIKVESLLSGDKAAIMLASRINGFGSDYRTMVTCPACQETTENVFDLSAVENYCGDDYKEFDVSDTGKGTYLIKTPRTKFDVEVKLLTSKDETFMIERMRSMNEKNETNTGYTDQLKMIIVSVDSVTTRPLINKFVESLPMFDARYIRTAYSRLNPSPEMKQEFECPSCGHKKEVEIPMTVNFFWSDQ